jgi:hypothetical protein
MCEVLSYKVSNITGGMSMRLSSSFKTLAYVVKKLDTDGWSIRQVKAIAENNRTNQLVGTIKVSTPFHDLPSASCKSSLEFISASIDDQELSLTFRTSTFSEFTVTRYDKNITISPTETNFENGTLLIKLKIVDSRQEVIDPPCSCTTASNPTTPKSDSKSGIQTELEAVRDKSVPPFKDTDYLQCLYDSCETFSEMSEKIDMDVADETVRRYMIDANIHSPSSGRTTKYNLTDISDGETQP